MVSQNSVLCCSDNKSLVVSQLVLDIFINIGFTITDTNYLDHLGTQPVLDVFRGLLPFKTLFFFVWSLLTSIPLTALLIVSNPALLINQPK